MLSYSEVILLENISSGTVSITGTHFDLVHVGPCKCPEIAVSEKRSYDILSSSPFCQSQGAFIQLMTVCLWQYGREGAGTGE